MPHVEFEKKEHAAIAAAWPVASDPAKRNVSAAPMYPLYLKEVHRLVVGLVRQVEALRVEVGSVKRFESEVSVVMGDLRKLAAAFCELDNLERLPEISKNLQEIVVVLRKLTGLETGEPKAGEAPRGSGGNEYIA